MKGLVWIIIIALIALGGWYLFSQSGSTQPEDTTTGDITSAMPADGNSTVDEMIDTSDTGASMNAETATPDVEISMTGKNFAFSETEIRVKEGDVVKINLTSTDGTHDWVVDEFNARTQRVTTGESTSVTFVADTVGEFEYYCSVGSHRQMGMVGKLIVE